MRVLLIDIATITDTFNAVEHSIGLMYLAAAARRAYGDRVQTRIRTLASAPDDLEAADRTTALLEDFRPDLVGFRCLSIGKDTLAVAVAAVKSWRQECVVVAGGPHPTDAPQETLLETAVDAIALGEGDVTFVDIIAAVEEGAPLGSVAGVAVRNGAGPAYGPPRELIRDLSTVARPAYDLVDLEEFTGKYITFSSRTSQRHANLLTSRGCPYRCMYCHNILGKSYRARPVDDVFDEIRWLHDTYGITDFQIIDDTFNLNRKQTKILCRKIADSDLDLTFSFPNAVRSDLLDEELMDLFAAMGVRFSAIAVETATPRLQKLIKKDLDVDKVFEVIEYLTSLKIATLGYFMLGFPTETLEEAERTVAFAVDSALTQASFFVVVYYPGTPLYGLARELGFFKDSAPEVRRDYVDIGEGPYAFDAAALHELKTRAIREFAFSRSRVERTLELLPRYYDRPDIDRFFLSYIASSGLTAAEVPDARVRELLKNHFALAEHFGRGQKFYF